MLPFCGTAVCNPRSWCKDSVVEDQAIELSKVLVRHGDTLLSQRKVGKVSITYGDTLW